MAEQQHDWKDLCNAVAVAKDPNEVLRLVQELSEVLELEETSWRDGRKKGRGTHMPKEARC